MALAASLAGRGMLAYGVERLDPMFDGEAALLAVCVRNNVLLFAMPDKRHRFISVPLVVAASPISICVWRLPASIQLLGLLLAAFSIYLLRRGWYQVVMPMRSGLIVAAFGCLVLSTVYVLPDLGIDFTFCPRPWIPTVLIGALLCLCRAKNRCTNSAGCCG